MRRIKIHQFIKYNNEQGEKYDHDIELIDWKQPIKRERATITYNVARRIKLIRREYRLEQQQ